mmetsp:Transcript_10479/g.32524  ORF Transcript_10479/g.32524 Transcript_10479/m.32524 type:complete len:92 (-) Transcript_10479:458-733(-)
MAHLAEGHGHGLLQIEIVCAEVAILQGRGGVLVHHAQHVDACDLGSIEQGLPLEVGEVRGHADDDVSHSALAPSLRDVLQLRKEHGRDGRC